MEFNGFTVDEYTVSGVRMNLIAFLLFIPIAVVNIGLFLLFWSYEQLSAGKMILFDYMLIILVAGIVFHEFLHGIGWAIFAKKGFRSIRFGINWNYFAPYCHCKEPLLVFQYRIGGALPLVVMGVIPSILALFFGSGFWLTFGTLFTAAAGGDIITLYMLRKISKNTQIFDHPEKMGFYVVKNQEEYYQPIENHA